MRTVTLQFNDDYELLGNSSGVAHLYLNGNRFSICGRCDGEDDGSALPTDRICGYCLARAQVNWIPAPRTP